MSHANNAASLKSRSGAANAFLVIVAGQILLWTIIPALTFHNVPLDVAENIAWGQEWQLGYYKHPPLQAWLTGLAFQGSGGSVWPIYLLSQIAVAACFLAIWKLGRDVVDDSGRLLAVAFFSLVYYASIPTPEFNANVLQMPFWALAPWFLWRGLNSGRMGWWIGLGVTVAAAFYTKYSVIFLAGALAAAALSVPQGRQALKTPGPYVAVAVAGLLAVPHIYWLVTNDFLPLQYAAARSAPLTGIAWVLAPLKFLAAQLADHAGALLLVAAGTMGRLPCRISRAWGIEKLSPAERFIIISAFAPVILATVFGTAKGIALRDMWAAPMFAFTGLAVAIWLRPHMPVLRRRTMIGFWAVLFVAAPVALGLVVAVGPQFGAKPGRMAYPGPELAHQLEGIWWGQTGRKLAIVAGETWETGVVSAYAPSHPSVFVDGDFAKNPWITRERIVVEGALVLWSGGPQTEMPARLATLGPAGASGTLLLPYAYGKRDMSLNWGIIMPENAVKDGAPK